MTKNSINVRNETCMRFTVPAFNFHHAFRFLSFSEETFLVFADEPPEEDNGTEPPTPEPITPDTEVVAEEDNNLTISCNHEHNGTVYQVILEKMPHGHPWGIIGVCKKVEGGLLAEDYSDRGRVSCTDSLDVSLHLTGVVQQDGGFYRCTFSTDAGVQTTTVLLTVPPPGTQTHSMQCGMYTCIQHVMTR